MPGFGSQECGCFKVTGVKVKYVEKTALWKQKMVVVGKCPFLFSHQNQVLVLIRTDSRQY